MLWWPLHTWEDVMLLSLAAAAIAAVLVIVSTYCVVQLQRAEIAESKAEFDRYKLEAAKEITAANAVGEAAKAEVVKANERISINEAETARANARANEAEVKLIEFRRPRSELVAPPEARTKITAALEPFKGTKFDVGYAREDREQADFLWWLLQAVNDAKWVHIDWVGGETFKRWNWPGDHLMGVMAVINVSIELHPDNREKLRPAAEALAGVLRSLKIATTVNDSKTAVGITMPSIFWLGLSCEKQRCDHEALLLEVEDLPRKSSPG